MYLHGEPVDGTPPAQGVVEERYVIPAHGLQHSLDTIVGPWTRRTNPREFVISDPYLASLSRAAPEYAACLAMEAEYLSCFAAQTGGFYG